uniref:Uncharacterized protein n=1 Tax=Arundo donax TaxID=35708 RepID=A0A0A8ZD70_ARUDO
MFSCMEFTRSTKSKVLLAQQSIISTKLNILNVGSFSSIIRFISSIFM